MDKELRDLLREVALRLLEAEVLYDSFPSCWDEKKTNLQTLEKVKSYLEKNK